MHYIATAVLAGLLRAEGNRDGVLLKLTREEPVWEGEERVLEREMPVPDGEEPIWKGEEAVLGREEAVWEGEEPVLEREMPVPDGGEVSASEALNRSPSERRP